MGLIDPRYGTLIVAQVTIAIVAVLLARLAFRVPLTVGAAAGALFNVLPLPPVFGVATPIFLHDLCVPLIVLMWVARGKPERRRLFWLGAFAALIWPMIGTLIGAASAEGMSEWVEFLYRRTGFVLFFLAGLSEFRGDTSIRKFLDTCVLIWIGMAAMGLLQYGGMVDTDISSRIADELRDRTILDSVAAARGFMGLNRGAVGVWGATMVAYCLAMLAFTRRLGVSYGSLYNAGAGVGLAVVLLAGSRTGVIAALAGAGFVCAHTIMSSGRRQVTRLGVFAGIVALGGAAAVARMDFTAIATRFALENSSLETGALRASVQRAALDYVLGDARALTVGMGQSTEQFIRLVGHSFGLAHTHSEYMEVLWQAGVPGMLLYLCLLWALFVSMGARRSASGVALSFAGQAMLVSGVVSALAVGNMFITSARLASFGMLMAFVYGSIVSELRNARSGAEEMTPQTP